MPQSKSCLLVCRLTSVAAFTSRFLFFLFQNQKKKYLSEIQNTLRDFKSMPFPFYLISYLEISFLPW